jgi:hypothetical protein
VTNGLDAVDDAFTEVDSAANNSRTHATGPTNETSPSNFSTMDETVADLLPVLQNTVSNSLLTASGGFLGVAFFGRATCRP